MKGSLILKTFAIFGLSILLLIPLLMIDGLISSRRQRQREVESDIAASAAGAQQLTGPILVVSSTIRTEREEKNEKTGRITKTFDEETQQHLLVPKELTIAGEAKVEERYRGLYKAQLYRLDAKLSGVFRIPRSLGLDTQRRTLSFGKAHLLLGVTDIRGIEKSPSLLWNGETREFAAGAHKEVMARGIQADLGHMDFSQDREIRFELPLNLMGTKDLSIVPVAEDTRVALTSNWPSPSFQGRFLPVKRQIGEDGFEATWQISHLARDLAQILEDKGNHTSESFEVTFLDPVNIYLMSERAVKYGFLFIGLTFAAFFLFEMLKRWPIHPFQYLLVGLSLGMFFLLLIGLSEHIRFAWAYLAAAASGVLLQGIYVSHVLKSRLRGMGFAASLAALYAVLYGLLISEDNALLMGSLLLFVILGAVMMITRKLDWYGLSSRNVE